MSGSKTLVTLMRRLVRTHGLAAMLDAIADVLDAVGDPSLAHDRARRRGRSTTLSIA